MNDPISDEKLLMKYAKTGNLNEIKILFENGVNICADDNYAIVWASYYGHLEIVKFLFENGTDICTQDNKPIVWASNNNQLDIVKFLFENGANIYTQDNYAIRNAAFDKRLNMVEFLLNYYYNNDNNLIYLLNAIYGLKLNFNENLINKIDILIWSIKLDKCYYFRNNFNEEYEIYDFIFNY